MRTLLCLLALLNAEVLFAADRYVSPSGSGTACTLAAPCALANAVANANGVKILPGDIVWLRGGTYASSARPYGYYQTVSGTATAPIIYRAYRGERAIIDSDGTLAGGVAPAGSYVWYWDLEVTNSDTVRTHAPDGFHGNIAASNIKLINTIIHDQASNGYLLGADVGSFEMYGCLLYYNGNYTNQRHGIYFAQNSTSPNRTLANNILFDNGGYNFHGYADQDAHYNLNVEGNISFQAGRLGGNSAKGDELLIGVRNKGTVHVGRDIRVANNYLYAADATRVGFTLGYEIGSDHNTIVNNYVVGGGAQFNGVLSRQTVMTGNFFQGHMSDEGVAHMPTAEQWPGNTIRDDGGRPGSGKVIYVTPNIYEPGRCHVAVFNWDHSPMVSVDLSTCVRSGDDYAVYWAPLFAARTAAVTGTYAGGTVSFPMTAAALGAMPNPVDPAMMQPPTTTLPEFAAFVVRTIKRRN